MRDYDDDNDSYPCDHNYHDTSNKEQDVFMKFLGAIVSLGIILVLGSYGYTWVEAKDDQEEKRDWRKDHQAQLDRRFDDLKHGQERLEDALNKNNEESKNMLQKILDEQRKVADNLNKQTTGR